MPAEVSLDAFPGRDIVPRTTRAFDILAHWVSRTPGALFDQVDGVRRTYAEAHADVLRCAAALEVAGVAPGDRIAVLTTPRPEFITLFLAASRLGATWVGLNPGYTRTELQHVVGDSRPVLIFAVDRHGDRDFADDVRALASETDSVRESIALTGSIAGSTAYADFLARGTGHALTEHRSSDEDAALLVYTSGTTGKPKGALISHRAFAAGCQLQASRYFHTGAAVLAYLPVNHIAGLLDLGCVPLSMGGALHYMADFDPDALLALIQDEDITMWGGIPTIFQITMARPAWADTDFSSLRHLVWGGAPMPIAAVPTLRATGAKLGTVYGLTESCVSFAYNDRDATDEQLARTIGKPDPRLDFRIGDGTPGKDGELLLRNPSLMTGYLHLPAATSDAFTPDGFLRTGDLARMREDGNIELVGRLTEMFKSGGYNVYPREVEAALESHPDVASVAVIDIPDVKFGQVGVAYIVRTPATRAEESADLGARLKAHCRGCLAAYKIPKAFIVIDELPRLTIGKVDRTALRRAACQ